MLFLKRFFVLCFLFIITSANAYLDPGTGSLLLSSVVAIFASAVYFLKNLFYKIISVRSFAYGKKNADNAKNSIVFYCEGARYYATFKPILDVLDLLHHPYTYLTSDESDPGLTRQDNDFSTKRYIGTGNKAYTYLNFLQADICVMTTPGLQVLQIKRSRAIKHYCHIVHSLTPMTYNTYGLDYFDSVLVTNQMQEDFVRDVEKAHDIKAKYIAIVGSTYLDELAILHQNLKEQTPKKDKTTILVSPSWGRESLLFKYGLRILEPLAKSTYNIIIRPHPQSLIGQAESENIKKLQSALLAYKNVEWDIGTPNVLAFNRADLMLSDFSSVIFDFLCLEGKPVITLDFSFDSAGYDLADIYDESNINEFWTFKALKQIGKKLHEYEISNITEIIEQILKSKEQENALNDIKAKLWPFKHHSGKQSTLEILKIRKNLLENEVDKNLLQNLDLLKNSITTLESLK